MRTLSQQGLWDILNGACILGCGGGGPLSLGTQLLQQVIDKKKPVKLADPVKDVADDAHLAIAAGVGSPLAAESGFPFDVASIAFKKLQSILAREKGKPFSYVLAGETGAGNSVIPMTVAVSLDLPIVDADGARRAIPELDQVTYASHDIPISPIVLANATQTISLTAPNPSVAGKAVDGVITNGAFQEDAGMALWAMNGKQMKKAAICYTVSYAQELGAALRNALQKHSDPVQAVCAYLGGKVLFTGMITNQQQQTRGGFDFGTITLTRGQQRLVIYEQNENLIAFSNQSGQPVAMAPDLICYLTIDGKPFTNADLDIAKGKEVVVIGVPCEKAMRDTAIVNSFLNVLLTLGYAGPYIPFQSGQGRAAHAGR